MSTIAALRQTPSKGQDPRHVELDHLDVTIAVGGPADRHLAALIRHLGADLERRALHLSLVDIVRLARQIVACETAWDYEGECSAGAEHFWGGVT